MPNQWWRDAVIYQIYPRSFADASGDGVGDLPGIISRLDHLATLGVDAVWLSPFYLSPMADGGYDVADYFTVDPLFGSNDDADRLITRAHELGLRVIIDLVPNHTSDEHRWFQAAKAAEPGSPERELYLFRDGKGAEGELPPNNWRSVFGGPGWSRLRRPDGTPEQWYLHLFDVKQPDLDWSSERVRSAFDEILRGWCDRGVDGFRVDVAHSLVKAAGMPDDDGIDRPLAAGQVGPAWDQDGVHEIYRRWHRVLSEYDGERMLVAEAWLPDPNRVARYVRSDEMQQAFNFDVLTCPWQASAYRRVITETLAANDAVGGTSTWVLSNHDVVRHASRLGLADTATIEGFGADDPQPDAELGLRRARAATMLLLALPGSTYLYQGEELGLPDHTTLPNDARQDPIWQRSDHTKAGRDGCRIPIPWQADAPALGFSPNGKTWLPQPEGYRALAVDQQLGDPDSTLEFYRMALRLRREHQLGAGNLRWLPTDDHVVGFDNGQLRVLANIGGPPVALPAGYQVIASSAAIADQLPADVTCWLASATAVSQRLF